MGKKKGARAGAEDAESRGPEGRGEGRWAGLSQIGLAEYGASTDAWQGGMGLFRSPFIRGIRLFSASTLFYRLLERWRYRGSRVLPVASGKGPGKVAKRERGPGRKTRNRADRKGAKSLVNGKVAGKAAGRGIVRIKRVGWGVRVGNRCD